LSVSDRSGLVLLYVLGEWPVFCGTLLNVADVLSGRAGHPADWLYAGLIWSNNALTESPVNGMSSHTIDLVVSANLFFSRGFGWVNVSARTGSPPR